MNSHPEYSYEPKGDGWVVYRWEYSGNTRTGSKVYESSGREQARKECFRLNGWKYTEPVPEKRVVYKSNVHWERMPGWMKFIVVTHINPRLGVPVTNENGLLDGMRDEMAETIRKQNLRVPVLLEVREDEGRKVLFLKCSGRVLVSIYVQ